MICMLTVYAAFDPEVKTADKTKKYLCNQKCLQVTKEIHGGRSSYLLPSLCLPSA